MKHMDYYLSTTSTRYLWWRTFFYCVISLNGGSHQYLFAFNMPVGTDKIFSFLNAWLQKKQDPIVKSNNGIIDDSAKIDDNKQKKRGRKFAPLFEADDTTDDEFFGTTTTTEKYRDNFYSMCRDGPSSWRNATVDTDLRCRALHFNNPYLKLGPFWMAGA